MTRKDYKIIAAALLASKPADIYINEVARKQWYSTVTEIARALASDNPRFDANKFFDAAEVPS